MFVYIYKTGICVYAVQIVPSKQNALVRVHSKQRIRKVKENFEEQQQMAQLIWSVIVNQFNGYLQYPWILIIFVRNRRNQSRERVKTNIKNDRHSRCKKEKKKRIVKSLHIVSMFYNIIHFVVPKAHLNKTDLRLGFG